MYVNPSGSSWTWPMGLADVAAHCSYSCPGRRDSGTGQVLQLTPGTRVWSTNCVKSLKGFFFFKLVTFLRQIFVTYLMPKISCKKLAQNWPSFPGVSLKPCKRVSLFFSEGVVTYQPVRGCSSPLSVMSLIYTARWCVCECLWRRVSMLWREGSQKHQACRH